MHNFNFFVNNSVKKTLRLKIKIQNFPKERTIIINYYFATALSWKTTNRNTYVRALY